MKMQKLVGGIMQIVAILLYFKIKHVHVNGYRMYIHVYVFIGEKYVYAHTHKTVC